MGYASRRFRLQGFCWTLLALLAPVTSAQTVLPPAKKHNRTDANESEPAKRGRVQFGQSCAFCHGVTAKGGAEGSNLILSQVVRHDDNGNLIGKVIREGRPEQGMPAIPLSTEQIADVVAFLHAQVESSDSRSSNGPHGGYSLKKLLTGNAEAGKEFFNGAGTCTHCHSATGDLAGIASRDEPAELQARFLAPRGDKKTATVSLADGNTVAGELLHLDAFTVAIRAAGGWYRSWPLTEVKVEVHDPLAAHRKLLDQYTDANVHDLFAYLETLK